MNNLDAFIGLLLFMAGAPALVLQFTPNDVRHILLKNKSDKWKFIANLYWPAVVGAVSTLGVFVFSNPTPCKWAEVGLLVLLIGLTIFVCVKILSYASKRDVVKKQADQAIGAHQKTEAMSNDYFENIRLLGRESKSSGEKLWAIEAVGKIASYRLSRTNYAGNEMEAAIDALRGIILEGRQGSSPEIFHKAIEILNQIIQKHRERPGLSQADLRWSLKALSDLGQEAIKFPTPDVTIACINVLESSSRPLSPSASQGLSEIASVALQEGVILVAMQALNIIGSAVYENGLEDTKLQEILYDYLGLLGAFWAHGESAQSIANRDLNDLKAGGKINLKELVERAIEHHRETMRFEVADKISKMWSEY